jgi:hypothetical protein
MDIPLSSNLRNYIINDPIKDDAMKIAIDTNHNVIPKPEPPIACGKALKGGKSSTLNSPSKQMTKSLLNWIEEQPIRKHS